MIKITKKNSVYQLTEIFVNPKQIIYLSDDNEYIDDLKSGKLPFDFHSSSGFTKIRVNGDSRIEEITVLGEPRLIEEKIRKTIIKNKKQLLKG